MKLQSLSHAEYRRTRRFPALDGMRAVTVLSLIALHFGFGDWLPLIGRGKITVFFVLSGFVITLLLLRDEEKYDQVRLRTFYIRRQFRILPAYYTVLLATIIVRYGAPQVGDNDGNWEDLRQTIPYYLTFTHEWAPEGTDIFTYVHSWTLAYEQKFYLVWPLVFILLTRYAPRWRMPAVAASTAGVAALIPVYGNTPTHYFALMLGCTVALICHEAHTYRVLRPLTHPLAMPFVLAMFIPVHVWVGGIVFASGDDWTALSIYAVAAAVLMVSVLHCNPVQWLLSRKPLQFVGERGYAVYLVHGMAGSMVYSLAPAAEARSVTRTLIIMVVAVILADALYRFVELPSAKLGQRCNDWLDRRKHARLQARAAGTPPAPPSPERSRDLAASGVDGGRGEATR